MIIVNGIHIVDLINLAMNIVVIAIALYIFVLVRRLGKQ